MSAKELLWERLRRSKRSAFRILLPILICNQAMAQPVEAPQQFAVIGDLPLVSGETLYDTRIGYRTAGALNDEQSNVIVFPTWFTGTSGDPLNFQKIGPGLLADTDRYYVIVIDALGNGVSTSPSNSERQPGADFPRIAVDDMVEAAHLLLTRHLGVGHVHAVIGISMGGMQVYQWIGRYPGYMDKAVAIDGSPRMTSYDLAQWNAHESAIETLRAAGVDDGRIMAFISSVFLLTVFTPDYFIENVPPEAWPGFLAENRKSHARQDVDDYLAQLRAMMAHDVYADHADAGRPYERRIQAELLVIGNPSDHAVNPVPGRTLAQSIGAQHVAIDSNCGHVGTTCEAETVAAIVNAFLEPGRSPVAD